MFFYSPIWNNEQFFDNNGNPLAGGKLFQFQYNSWTVNQTTYNGQNGSANPNPIVLDASGRIPVDMWLQQGLAYNYLLTDSTGAPNAPGVTIRQAVNVIGQEPSTVAGAAADVNLWNESVGAPTFVSSDSFLLAGNQTSTFAVGNRVQFLNGVSTFGYGTIITSAFSGTSTQVTLQTDSTAVGSNITEAFWSALVTPAITVDAGAVSYSTDLAYTNPATVGGQIAALATELTTVTTDVGAAILDRNEVYLSGGTFSSGGTAFTLAPTPAATGLTSNESYDVVFNVAGGTAPTLNISGLGAAAVVQLNDAGAYVAATITAGLTSRILYNGAQYTMQAVIPPAPITSGNMAATGHWVDEATGYRRCWGFQVVSATGGNYPQTFDGGGFPIEVFGCNISPLAPAGVGGAGSWELTMNALSLTGMTIRTVSSSSVNYTVYYEAWGH